MGRTAIFDERNLPIGRDWCAGVSLHGHTSKSREELKFLSGFRRQFPLIPMVLKVAARHHHKATGEILDIRRAGWHPPLKPHRAFAIEKLQLENLGLRPLVSLSDHDDITASQIIGSAPPVSVEWTVPFQSTFFHIGVHNLPESLWPLLQDYTTRPSARRLADAMSALHAQRDVLVVFNHPLWDEAELGPEAHRAAVRALLSCCSKWIHAIEVNGLRSRTENRAAAELAECWRKPVVSGGDRHGAEPNAVINLTNAGSFAEFVSEVRRDGQSTVQFLPQYGEPLRLRWLQTVWDIVRSYPAAEEGWRHWSDRFFYRCQDGLCRSVAEVWKSPRPPVLNQVLAMLRVAEWQPFRPALRFVLADQGE
jgi:hypothetical protein